MNKVFLLGRLTRDPEVRYTGSGRAVCQFTLAVNRPFKTQNNEQEADFLPVVLWGQQAEQCGNNVKKGQRLLVEGRVQTRSYDAKDGTKRYVTEVIADRFEYIELKGSAPTGGSSAAPAGSGPSESGMSRFGSPVPFDEQIPF